MDEKTPSPAPDPKSQATGDASASAEDAAVEALKTAQDAVSDLKTDAAAESAASPAAISAAEAAIAKARAANGGATAGNGGSPLPLPNIAPGPANASREAIGLLADVNLHVKIELGRTRMLVEDVLRLGEGSVVELDKLAGDPVDVFVNDRPVARGEVLVLNDNFCIRINEIVSQAGDGR